MKTIHQRARKLTDKAFTKDGPVVYWMSRDQRVNDNWALIYATEIAKNSKQPLVVIFTLTPSYPGAVWRHYHFMLEGLKEVEQQLTAHQIPFKVLIGEPAKELGTFVKEHKVSALVSDFDPLRTKQQWKKQLNTELTIPHWEVDAHNIVPCWIASPKLEFAAYTLRPKIKKLLNTFLTEFAQLELQQENTPLQFTNHWDSIEASLQVTKQIGPVNWITPGEAAAKDALQLFLSKVLPRYNDERNDPTADAVSNLSPYLHFGQLSAQRIAINCSRMVEADENTSAFLEELIIRKELSDNFCFYNPAYDRIEGAHAWAQKTLSEHKDDEREFRYTQAQFEEAVTHDDLWNAAQKELVNRGKMHGFMRMYWAKKILEWTKSPEQALEIAIFLNDKFSLDGRDPNGYVGCMWSIAGVHDRAWNERPVYGKVRYMNYNGCKRKFDVKRYINRMNKL